jgi:hypothetical protein
VKLEVYILQVRVDTNKWKRLLRRRLYSGGWLARFDQVFAIFRKYLVPYRVNKNILRIIMPSLLFLGMIIE